MPKLCVLLGHGLGSSHEQCGGLRSRGGGLSAAASLHGDDVLLADGSRVQPDAVIAATGYRRGLEPLVGHLGVLDDKGMPLVTGGRQHPSAPGLFFTGYRTELSGQMRLMRFDARSIARALT
jgi:putative flavoprotein involved in K+ transport